MSKFLRPLIVALAVVASLAPLTIAPARAGTTGGISGSVVDDKGAPVANAHITAVSPSQLRSAVADAKGFYSILNLSPDTYSVTASKDGFDTVTVSGYTVQADQTTVVDLTMHATVKVIGHVTATAMTTVVNKSVTGDLYAVNAQSINSYQGSAGGAETLYSQNGVVGSLPGVVRTIGTGGGYGGNGSLSMRGGTTDQVGFELEGIPLNRAFDAANATSFVTNGLASLEVYTGGEPADAGRAMAGYINEQIRRGTYPGGSDMTLVAGTPDFNHTVQMDAFGGTPDSRFTWYVSTLAVNAAYNFSDRNNLDNTTIAIGANDPTCAYFNSFNGTTYNCGQSFNLNVPISQPMYWGLTNIAAHERDTVANIHIQIPHHALSDDLQALYVVGTTASPFCCSGYQLDPNLADATTASGQVSWPFGQNYNGAVGQAFNPNAYSLLTWPTSGGSTGPVPAGYIDSQSTESAIEKLSYTRELTSSSFLRLYGYALYSLYGFDQATNPNVGDSFYQLHDNSTGFTLNYQNQLNSKHLLRVDLDYVKDLSLRYNYAPDFFTDDSAPDGNSAVSAPGQGSGLPPHVLCYNGAIGDLTNLQPCTLAATNTVAFRGSPYAYWNKLPAVDTDAAVADSFHVADNLLLDVGARIDRFHIELAPLQITGSNGLAEQAQNQWGTCLDGYAYPVGEPCNAYLTSLGQANLAPGAGKWQNVSGSLDFNEFSPRVGVTYTLPNRDVLRFSVGRYVEPANTYGEEYVAAPFFGAGNTVSVLNNFYDGLGFVAVHDVKPQDSTNFDASYERDFGHGWSAKITPFYRNTRNQILSIPVTPNNPTFVTGYNFGTARIKGSEFLVRRNPTGPTSVGVTLAATYTDSKIRYERTLGATNFIDTINNQIAMYNGAYGTHFPLFDPNGYYSPSETQSFNNMTPSFDVRWVVNLGLDYRTHGFTLAPTFNYQSGNPYGDPLQFPDIGVQALTYGPDPYTHKFDGLGSLVGPSWLTMNMAVSHELGTNVKASFLVTNIFTSVHNHGYPWEYPSSDQVLSYGDNPFYYQFAPQSGRYIGDSYYPYAPSSLNPIRSYVFSLSTKL